MAEDWDLEAVVRGCKSATKTTTSTTSSTAITAAINSNTAALEAEMSLWDWLKAEVENDPFSFPNLVEPRDNAFQELQQFYKPFYLNPTINNNTTTSYGIIPNPPIISDFGGSSGQRHHQQQQLHHFLPTNTTIRPHFNPATIPVSSFGGFHEQQQQAQQQMLQQNQIQPQQQQPQNHQQGFAAPIPPTMQIQPPRSRKRKSQQKRLVCQVRAENLSGDLWAWRKYGQKPIKGSPHPRNYYRCSSTKGCAARKQVERSTTDPDIFIVTYTGDHTHPRPTHRNSLAGSTRAKLSSAAATSSHNKPANKDFNSGSPNAAASPLSASSSLSTPPLQADKDGADQEVDDEEMDNDEDENEDEDGLLIPNNMVTSDDIFMGLQQLETNTFRGTTGTSQMATVASGGNFSNKGQPNLGSSWAGTHSSSAGATVGGGF